jgi:predicted flap endonuclease-1-like 5' DNA nuclease
MTPEPDDSTTEQPPNMLVFTADGPTVECANFKAIDEGVLLFEDEKRKRVVGFVPHSELRFVLPGDVGVEYRDEREAPPETESERDRAVRSVTTEPETGEEMPARAPPDRPGEHHEPSTEDGIGTTGEEEAESADEEEAESADEEEAESADEERGERTPEGETEVELDVEEEEERYVEAEDLEVTEREGESEAPQGDATSTEEYESEETVGAVTADLSSSAEPASADDLTRLGGLGETYANRLRDAGIGSLDALRAANVEDVANAAEVAPRRAERWIEAAERRTSDADDESEPVVELSGDEAAADEAESDDVEAGDVEPGDAESDEPGETDDEPE